MNMKFHIFFAKVKEILGHDGNQVPFSEYTVSNLKKKKLMFYRKQYMYEVELFHHFFLSRIFKNFLQERHCRSRSDCTDCTV